MKRKEARQQNEAIREEKRPPQEEGRGRERAQTKCFNVPSSEDNIRLQKWISVFDQGPRSYLIGKYVISFIGGLLSSWRESQERRTMRVNGGRRDDMMEKRERVDRTTLIIIMQTPMPYIKFMLRNLRKENNTNERV